MVEARGHQPKPADDVWSKGIGGQVPRNSDDDVSGERDDAAPRNQLLAVLEKARRVAKIRVDPDDVAEQRAADPRHDVRMARGTFEIQQRRAAAERAAGQRPDLPFERRLRRQGHRHEKRQGQKSDSHVAPASPYVPGWANSPRNSRPK